MEQILEGTSRKTTAVRPNTSYLKEKKNKMDKVRGAYDKFPDFFRMGI